MKQEAKYFVITIENTHENDKIVDHIFDLLETIDEKVTLQVTSYATFMLVRVEPEENCSVLTMYFRVMTSGFREVSIA